jgi:hypothetical protein
MSLDGFEDAQLQQAIRRSVVETTSTMAATTPTNPNDGDILYAASRVWIDTQPHNKLKGKLQGSLALKRVGGNIMLTWFPAASKKKAGESGPIVSNYIIEHLLEDCFSLKGKGSTLTVILAAEGGPGTSLPPFTFDAGAKGVREFLGYMQVNLAQMSASAP